MSADVLLSDVVIDRDLLEAEARALVDSIRVDITDVGERIATAYKGRAWIALGYTDWDALCDGEFEGARLRVPREVRAELVQSLSAAGLSTRTAAKALGVSKDTVQRDLAAGVSDETPARGPVTGKDGKQYAPTQPARTTPEPAVATAEAAPAPDPGAAHDIPVNEHTGEVLDVGHLPIEQHPDYQETGALDDALERQLASTDDRFLLNLARAMSACNSLLALSPQRAVQTCTPGSDDHAALMGFLNRMEGWTNAVRRPTASHLRSVR